MAQDLSINPISQTILASGDRDPSFDVPPPAGFNDRVWSTSIQEDGKVIVGGAFNSYQDNPAGYLIRLQD